MTAAGTRLRGRRLALARGAWVVLATLALGIFLAAIPAQWAASADRAEAARRALAPLAGDPLATLLDRLLAAGAYPALALAVETLSVLVFAGTAIVVFRLKADDWMVLFITIGLVCVADYGSPAVQALVQGQPAWRPLVDAVRSVGIYVAITFFYLFPDGRFTPAWTRPVAIAWTACVLSWVVWPGSPVSLAYPYDAGALPFALLVAAYSSGLLAQVVRHRRLGSEVARQQTTWVVLGVVIAFLSYTGYRAVGYAALALDLPALRIAHGLFGIPLHQLVILTTPLSFAFAILRFRLYEIDVIVNRVLVYGTLTAALALVYTAAVVLLQRAVTGLTGRQESQLAVVASTLAIAALFQPLRRRIQAFIDRRFYRRRYDAQRTLAAFGARLRDDTDLDHIQADLVGVVQETLQPAHVALWLRRPAGRGDRPGQPSTGQGEA